MTKKSSRSTPVLAAVLAFPAIFAAACGAGPEPTVSPPAQPAPAANAAPASAATTDGVAWVDSVCGAVRPAAELASKQPMDLSGSSGLGRYRSYLDQAGTAIDEAITGLAAAGPSPLAGGDQAVASLNETLQHYAGFASQGKAALDSVNANDPAAMAKAFPKAMEPLTRLRALPDPMTPLQENPEIAKAAQQAAQCRQLAALRQ